VFVTALLSIADETSVALTRPARPRGAAFTR
jgi:hypothetical protein